MKKIKYASTQLCYSFDTYDEAKDFVYCFNDDDGVLLDSFPMFDNDGTWSVRVLKQYKDYPKGWYEDEDTLLPY